MSEKSYVGMGYDVCPVCGVEHNEIVLLNIRSRPTLTQHEFTGFTLCPEHQTQRNDGYVFLVELSREPRADETRLVDTWPLRTGVFAALRKKAAEQIFDSTSPLAFCTADLIAKLQEMQLEAELPTTD